MSFTPFPAVSTPISITDLTEKVLPVIGDEIQISDSENSDSSKKIKLTNLLNSDAGGVEVGTVLSFTGSVAPTGYLICDGTTLNRTTYSDLYSVMGDAFGNGDGATTFQIADFRGKFLRMTDGGSANDPDAVSRIASGTGGNTGDAVGSAQASGNKNHNHLSGYKRRNNDSTTQYRYGFSDFGATQGANTDFGGQGFYTYRQANTETVGDSTESRPINVNVNYIVKY